MAPRWVDIARPRINGRWSTAAAILLVLNATPATAQEAAATMSTSAVALEGYPTDIAQSLLTRKLAEDEAIRNTPAPALFSFVAKNFTWQNGTKLIVAFHGGRYEVWKDIAAIAAQWSSEANITFDFGIDPVARAARTYTPGDPPSIAQVRIDLSETTSIRWSAVGRQALVKEFGPASMQLGGIAQNHPFWTDEDRADILHEFGHVLGFLHEHQRPDCIAEYRLERGPKGEPTIFDVYQTVYGAKPKWTTANILLSSAYAGDGSHQLDKRSLFIYPMPDGILPGTLNGIRGPCYVPKKNLRLSAGDKKRARHDYPFQPGNAFGNFALSNIGPLKSLALGVGSAAVPLLTEKLERMELAARPLVYIQIAHPEQRATGERLRRALLQSRYIAPGVENIAGKAKPPASVEVRYFAQADQAAASTVAELVAEELGTGTHVQIRLLTKQTIKRQPLEVWLPSNL